jgi:hypothetical protein
LRDLYFVVPALRGTAVNAITPSTLTPLPGPVIPPHPHRPGSPWLAGFDRRDFLEVGACDTAPSTVRGWMRERLPLWGLAHLLELAELVGSELVTNSVTATREFAWEGSLPPVRVWLLGSNAGVTIPVWDAVARAPVKREPGLDEESGRGLGIVAALSARWDFYFPSHPFAGKITWASIQISEFTEG